MKGFWKWLSWVFLIVSLGLILALTLQNPEGTMELSGGFLEELIRLVQKLGVSKEWMNAAWWNDPGHIRKVGHVLEYFILGLSAAFLFCRKGKRFVGKALLFCAVVSLLDQTLKEILPTRHFDVTDLPFDLIGYGCGILVVLIGWGIGRLVKGRKKQHNMELKE